MHKMNQTPKILTIIGLALEGVAVLTMFMTGWMFKSIFNEDFFTNLDPTIDMSEVQFIIDLYQAIGLVLIIVGIVLLIVFTVNMVLFIKLMREKYTEEQAYKVYTYQLVWGIISVFLNTITGILYIVSAVKGRSNEPDKVITRDGI